MLVRRRRKSWPVCIPTLVPRLEAVALGWDAQSWMLDLTAIPHWHTPSIPCPRPFDPFDMFRPRWSYIESCISSTTHSRLWGAHFSAPQPRCHTESDMISICHCLSVCLSFYRSIFLSFYLCIFLPIDRSIYRSIQQTLKWLSVMSCFSYVAMFFGGLDSPTGILHRGVFPLWSCGTPSFTPCHVSVSLETSCHTMSIYPSIHPSIHLSIYHLVI